MRGCKPVVDSRLRSNCLKLKKLNVCDARLMSARIAAFTPHTSMETPCTARLLSTRTRRGSVGPREERRSPGRPRVAGAPRRPRIRLSCARACAREPSLMRRSSPCRPRPDRHCPWVRGACRGSVLSWPCWPPLPLRYGGGSEPTPVGSERADMSGNEAVRGVEGDSAQGSARISADESQNPQLRGGHRARRRNKLGCDVREGWPGAHCYSRVGWAWPECSTEGIW